MAIREAACSCGQLRLRAEGDPFHVGLCHCLACQRRTGSAFGMQAGFKAGQVTISGRYAEYPRISDEADRKVHVFHFCRDCGGTVFYTEPDERDLVVVMVGAFADPGFPPPMSSGYHAAGTSGSASPTRSRRTTSGHSCTRCRRRATTRPPPAAAGSSAVDGDPVRVSICHCLACQRRTGSAFGYQARFPAVGHRDRPPQRVRQASRRRRGRAAVPFLPGLRLDGLPPRGGDPDLIAVVVGGFADPSFPPPTVAVYESRRHPWLELPAEIERDDAWAELLPLYEAGDYGRWPTAASRWSRLSQQATL